MLFTNLADDFLTFMLGQLFLGYFSGPVEGILIIITIYIITGFHGSQLIDFLVSSTNVLCTGPSFWDQDLWKVTHLDHIPFMKSVPNLRLNESFMAFGGVSLSLNIIVRFFIQFLSVASVISLPGFFILAILMFDDQPALKRKVPSDLSYF